MTPNVDETASKLWSPNGQSLRVTNPEVDFRRHSFGGFDHAGADVDGTNHRSAVGTQPGGPPGAGGDIQSPLARLRQQPVYDVAESIRRKLADPLIIPPAGTPGRRRPLVVDKNVLHRSLPKPAPFDRLGNQLVR
jgi:hypothetical protein